MDVQVVLPVRREDVGLRFGEHVQVIVVRLRDLVEQIWVGRGRGKGGGPACLPVDVRVVAGQPREAQDEPVVPQRHDVAGKGLTMIPMNA